MMSDAGLLGLVVKADADQAQKAVTNAAATIKSTLKGGVTEAEFKKAAFVIIILRRRQSCTNRHTPLYCFRNQLLVTVSGQSDFNRAYLQGVRGLYFRESFTSDSAVEGFPSDAFSAFQKVRIHLSKI